MTNSTLIKLFKLGRPQFLVIGVAVYLFGAAWAALSGASFSLTRFILGALVILLAQLSVSYSNEYFDQVVDRPGKTTPFSGGSCILAADPGLALVARWIALVLMAASILACAVFIWIYAYPWWMMLFAVLGNLGGWYYSAPPLRLSARGLGEICYTLLFGILVPAMGYLSLRGAIDSSALPVMVPLFFYSLVSILDVELPDLEVDLKGEKKTWVVRWGRHFGFRLIGILLLAGTACFFLLPLFYDWPLPRVFYTLGFLSFIPLSTGLAGWFQHRLTRERVTRCAVWILASLLLFVISVDAYLIWVSIQR